MVRSVPAFEGGLEAVVQLGERGGSGVQRLILDHAQLGNEAVDLAVFVALSAHAATLPDRRELPATAHPSLDDRAVCAPRTPVSRTDGWEP